MKENTGAVSHFKFKRFQKEDLARFALHNGAVLGWATGIGKTIAMFILPCLWLGFHRKRDGHRPSLQPNGAALFVVPGDLHEQVGADGQLHFNTKPIPIPDQATFLRLSTPESNSARRKLPDGYYITSYTQLSQNGALPFPKLDRNNPYHTLQLLNLNPNDVTGFFNQRAQHLRNQYIALQCTAADTINRIQGQWLKLRKAATMDSVIQSLDAAWYQLKNYAAKNTNAQFTDLDAGQRQAVVFDFVSIAHRELSLGVGEGRWLEKSNTKIKCVYSPTLADLCQDTFDCVIVDEGVKIKGEETLVGTGTRQLNPRYRAVLSATPIKNRLPDAFRLMHWGSGGLPKAHARFPFEDSSEAREEFSHEFMVSERNLTKEEKSEDGRRFEKLTPQVCNIHRLWKLCAPNILRRRKEDCGEDIVKKIRHVVPAPMGAMQAAVYKYHLAAKYLDKNERPAIGAKLQALRMAAANPASGLLQRPDGDTTSGRHVSKYSYVPKVASALSIIKQVLDRGEQVVVFSAFHDSLDALSARLNECGVRHSVLDGRVSQAKRGRVSAQFKLGPASGTPVQLAGVECMAEGHSYPLCNNVVLMAYSWAWDKFEQAINRVHRMNSIKTVNAYSIICEGSIDRKLEALIQEKGDAAELVLDGQLLGENSTEVNLAELLHIAMREFDGNAKTISEEALARDWPALCSQLAQSYVNWQYKVRADKIEDVASSLRLDITPIELPVETIIAPRPLEPIYAELPLWKFIDN